jgi:hypothetical protein
MIVPARGGRRSRPPVLPNTPPGKKGKNFLRHCCNNIAGTALVIEHHRNTGRSP